MTRLLAYSNNHGHVHVIHYLGGSRPFEFQRQWKTEVTARKSCYWLFQPQIQSQCNNKQRIKINTVELIFMGNGMIGWFPPVAIVNAICHGMIKRVE